MGHFDSLWLKTDGSLQNSVKAVGPLGKGGIRGYVWFSVSYDFSSEFFMNYLLLTLINKKSFIDVADWYALFTFWSYNCMYFLLHE